MEAGLLQFERRIPEILAGKGNQAGREEKEVSGENGDKGENRQDGSPVITVGGAKTQAPQIPQNAFEENYKKELSKAMRDFGQKHPLAGYPMDMSIWLFRGGEASAQAEDAGPAGVRQGGGSRGLCRFSGDPQVHQTLYCRLPGEGVRIQDSR